MPTLRSLAFHARNFAYQVPVLWGSEKVRYPRYTAVGSANDVTVSCVRDFKCNSIAEIGIYEGYTSIEIARVLNGIGELHLFDFEDKVARVRQKIEAAGFSNVKTFGSSYKLLDSYNWHLGKLVSKHDSPIYDYVFIDGAHTFAIDALTFFLSDRLLKIGGYIDFDDYEWTLAGSSSLRPDVFPLTRKLYTPEQINCRQVKMIVDALVRKSGRYKEVLSEKVFQKLS
jgi:hypothetical protein